MRWGLGRAAWPLSPARPALQVGEEIRRRPDCSPPACGRGWGRVFRRGRDLGRAARPLSPTRPPPQAGEGRNCGGGSTASFLFAGGVGGGFLRCGRDLGRAARLLSPIRHAPRAGKGRNCGGGGSVAPLPPAGGVGGGSFGAGGTWAVPCGRWPPPGLPRERGRGGIAAVVAPSLPSRLREGLREGLSARRDLGRVARPLTPTRPPPANGGGE